MPSKSIDPQPLREIAIEVGIVYKNACNGRDVTVEAVDRLAALVEAREREARIAGAKAFVTHLAGKRCKNKDIEDFPELIEKDARCYTCEMWEHLDEWTASLPGGEGEAE